MFAEMLTFCELFIKHVIFWFRPVYKKTLNTHIFLSFIVGEAAWLEINFARTPSQTPKLFYLTGIYTVIKTDTNLETQPTQ